MKRCVGWGSLQVRVRRGRDAEADASGRRLLGEQHFQLGAEEVRGEAELAALLVKHRHQVVRQHVAVRVCDKRTQKRPVDEQSASHSTGSLSVHSPSTKCVNNPTMKALSPLKKRLNRYSLNHNSIRIAVQPELT